jgi:hypothetical protein
LARSDHASVSNALADPILARAPSRGITHDLTHQRFRQAKGKTDELD